MACVHSRSLTRPTVWDMRIQINDKITVVTVCKDAHDTEMPTMMIKCCEIANKNNITKWNIREKRKDTTHKQTNSDDKKHKSWAHLNWIRWKITYRQWIGFRLYASRFEWYTYNWDAVLKRNPITCDYDWKQTAKPLELYPNLAFLFLSSSSSTSASIRTQSIFCLWYILSVSILFYCHNSSVTKSQLLNVWLQTNENNIEMENDKIWQKNRIINFCMMYFKHTKYCNR